MEAKRKSRSRPPLSPTILVTKPSTKKKSTTLPPNLTLPGTLGEYDVKIYANTPSPKRKENVDDGIPSPEAKIFEQWQKERPYSVGDAITPPPILRGGRSRSSFDKRSSTSSYMKKSATVNFDLRPASAYYHDDARRIEAARSKSSSLRNVRGNVVYGDEPIYSNSDRRLLRGAEVASQPSQLEGQWL